METTKAQQQASTAYRNRVPTLKIPSEYSRSNATVNRRTRIAVAVFRSVNRVMTNDEARMTKE